MILSAIWNKRRPKLQEPVGRVQFVAYLFIPNAQEKSFDYLLIMYMKKIEMVKQMKRTYITQSDN